MSRDCARQSGQTLIGLVVVLLIIMALTATYWGRRPTGPVNPDNPAAPNTVLGQAMQRGESVGCMNNLDQIRKALQMDQTAEGTWPASLQELKLGDSMLKCPVGGEPYRYDPKTGRVWCVHPGHQKF